MLQMGIYIMGILTFPINSVIIIQILRRIVMRMDSVRPDARGRIYLGDIAKGISSYSVELHDDGKITLDPKVEIPAREAWLYQNNTALNSVKRGLKDTANGRVSQMPDFSGYLDDE